MSAGSHGRAAGIGFKIVKESTSQPQAVHPVRSRTADRADGHWRRERHRDLPLATVSDEELRLRVCQRHTRKIKTDFLSDFPSRGRFQHVALGSMTST